MRTLQVFQLVAVLAAWSAALPAQGPIEIRPRLDNPGRLAEWTLDGSGGWEIRDGALTLSRPGVPAGPIRRPAALAVLISQPFGKVTLEADVRSDEPVDLAVRDVNIVVGYQSPSRFYYIHLSAVTDAVHNGIFVVADADRRRLDAPTSVPQLKDQSWHRVRIERDPASGRIAVFMDGAAKPVLEATDTTLQLGRVGLGSFDETARFRNVVVRGEAR